MSREKQIEEMTNDLCNIECKGMKCNVCGTGCEYRILAEALYNAGYRKQSEPFSRPHEKGGEWISVEERLPESEKIVLVSALSKTFRYRHTLMVAHIGHHEFTTEDSDWREYEGDTEYDEENDCFWIPECWYEVNSVEDNGNWIIDSDYDVTHWMPLPEPPKKGGAE